MPGVRRTGPAALLRRAAAALLAAGVLAACSTVPSASPTQPIPQGDRAPQPQVGIEARGPQPDASPEDIVRGFLDAAASPVRGHPVARQFLSSTSADRWSDTAGVTVIRSDYAAVSTGSGEVELTASVVGSVDERGSFTVAGGQSLQRAFSLQKENGQWRISDPPNGLIILEPDFTQTYDERDAFFLDPTGGRLVPDPLFLVIGPAQPTTLVERMLTGPSAALAPGVTNPLGGASLRSSVSLSGQAATVDLTGIRDPSPARLSALSGQLVWTLAEVSVRTVRILLDGEPIAVEGVPQDQTVDDWAALDPDAAPVESVGHYLSGGALHTITAGQPAPGPAGTGVYGLVTAAVSADPRTGVLVTLVGVTAGAQPALLAGPYGGPLAPVLTGASFSPPTVAANRQEIWTVRNGNEVIRLPSGGSPQTVDASELTERGPITSFQLSPDGVRAAAVLVVPGSGPQLLVATVVRTDAGVSLSAPEPVAPGLVDPAGVSWRNDSVLLVLASDQETGRMVPWTVGVDGWDLSQATTAGLPSEPTAVAAAPSRQPLVSAGGNVWRLSGGRWVTLVPGSGPLPGEAPFYPL